MLNTTRDKLPTTRQEITDFIEIRLGHTVVDVRGKYVVVEHMDVYGCKLDNVYVVYEVGLDGHNAPNIFPLFCTWSATYAREYITQILHVGVNVYA